MPQGSKSNCFDPVIGRNRQMIQFVDETIIDLSVRFGRCGSQYELTQSSGRGVTRDVLCQRRTLFHDVKLT
jgi:hypothetical protein